MKKVITVLMYVLMVLISAVLLSIPGLFVAACFNYELELIHLPFYTALLAGLSVCLVILTLVFRYETESAPLKILLAFLLLLSMVNAAFCISVCRQLSVIICSVIQIGCCGYLTVRYGSPRIWKRAILIECVLLLLPFIVICYTGKDFPQKTVMNKLISPDGAHYVQVEAPAPEHDEDAVIAVYKNNRFEFFIFGFTDYPGIVYSCDQSELDRLDIRWKDESSLIIDSQEYRID